MAVPFVTQAGTANGGANRILTVASTTGFVVGAYCFLSSDTQLTVPLVIDEVISATQMAVRSVQPALYSRFNCSAYLLAANLKITQPNQISAANMIDAAAKLS